RGSSSTLSTGRAVPQPTIRRLRSKARLVHVAGEKRIVFTDHTVQKP
ncbi:MAG: hypothetical protein ACI9WU_004853, partial [Myxococcota bacterium]